MHAACYGHTGALTTLLAHGANPGMKLFQTIWLIVSSAIVTRIKTKCFYVSDMENSRGEKALDLAALYGRLQVVQMLVRAHPELLLPYKKPGAYIFSHTPLHLASRNGHKHVVEVLLAAGVYVSNRFFCQTIPKMTFQNSIMIQKKKQLGKSCDTLRNCIT